MPHIEKKKNDCTYVQMEIILRLRVHLNEKHNDNGKMFD
jgi:hypothetical protein